MSARRPAVLAAMLAVACGEDEPAGDCGDVRTGDVSVSGDARLDGFFAATQQLDLSTAAAAAIVADELAAIAARYGLPAGPATADYADDVAFLIENDVDVHATSAFAAVYRRPVCGASTAAAYAAQVACERDLGCESAEVPADPPVTCRGRCQGECSSICAGDAACGVAIAAATCAGGCAGACAPDEPGGCAGACFGACMGECPSADLDGLCSAACDGICDGTCLHDVALPCAGACTGTCWLPADDPACVVPASCDGGCAEECRGACMGAPQPQPLDGKCDLAPECVLQAAALGIAAYACTSAALRIDVVPEPELDGATRDAFVERIADVERRLAEILRAGAVLDTLLAGELDGLEVVDPTPAGRVSAAMDDLRGHDIAIALAVAADRRACVEPALEQAVELVRDLPDRHKHAIAAYERIVDLVARPVAVPEE